MALALRGSRGGLSSSSLSFEGDIEWSTELQEVSCSPFRSFSSSVSDSVDDIAKEEESDDEDDEIEYCRRRVEKGGRVPAAEVEGVDRSSKAAPRMTRPPSWGIRAMTLFERGRYVMVVGEKVGKKEDERKR